MANLYHYTSLHGLLGMLSGKSLWATDVRFLNDSNEFEHALQIVNCFSRQMYMDDDYLERFGLQVAYTVDNLYAENLFVTSFSERSDLLSQWRGYCPAGGGVCIGFDTEKILEFCQQRGYRLEKCIYDPNLQAQQIESILNGCYARYPIPQQTREEFEALTVTRKIEMMSDYSLHLTQGGGQEQANAAMKWLRDELSELAPRFKDNGFHEEAEWRLVVKNPKEDVKFRVSASSTYFIPYVELNILTAASAPALREIIIGPNPNQTRCTLSINQLLATRGLTHVELHESKIPFNNW